jgi:hypothetical protein
MASTPQGVELTGEERDVPPLPDNPGVFAVEEDIEHPL